MSSGGGESDEERQKREAAEQRAVDQQTAGTTADANKKAAEVLVANREKSAQSQISVDFSEAMQKARIYKWADSWQLVTTAQFNPTQLVIEKKSKYEAVGGPNKNVETMTFGGGEPATLTVELFFDSTRSGADVRQAINPLVPLLMLTGTATLQDQVEAGEDASDDEKTRVETTNQQIDAANAAQIAANAPPKCKFVWGRIMTFEAYLTKLNQTFKLFLPDGTPVRATVKLTFMQARDETVFPPQNPTSRSADRKLWVVTAGETLDWIAYKEYGNPALWRHIAEANNLDNPRDLRPGQQLRLTPLAAAARRAL
jgi:nucleoid-associated protein YgaU